MQKNHMQKEIKMAIFNKLINYEFLMDSHVVEDKIL